MALEVELRQLLEAMELALEATGRPLRVLEGETVRGDLARCSRLWDWAARFPEYPE